MHEKNTSNEKIHILYNKILMLRCSVDNDRTDFRSTVRQQCVADFLTSICVKIDVIEDCISFVANEKHTCVTCEGISNNFSQDCIKIALPNTISIRSLNLQKIIDYHFMKNKISYDCDKINKLTRQKCNGTERYSQPSVIIDKDIIVIQIKLFNFNLERRISEKITGLELEDIPLSILKIHSHEFRVVSVICHKGQSIESGHYVTYLRQQNNSWTEVNDNEVTNNYPWKQHKGEPYLLFLEKL